MENPLGYDAFGRRRTRVVKAVVAARYENASQTFGKLCLKFGPLAQLRPQTAAQSYLLDDALARLTTWGHETGAEDQTLDHKLRKSEDMRETVLEALHELQTSLEEALQLLDDENLQDWYARADEERDGTTTPSIVAYDDGQKDSDQEEEPGADDATAVSVGDSRIFELLKSMSQVFEYIHDNVANLVFLGPSLEHPYPQDIDTYSSSLSNASEVSDQVDIDRAKLEFPYASGTIQRRLGHANWKRRIAQMIAQSHIHKEGKARPTRATKPQPASRAHRQDVAQDAFNFQRPTLQPEPKGASKQASFLPLVPADASTVLSDTTSMFDADQGSSRLSRAESATTLATMATVDSKRKQAASALATNLASASKGMFPPPPVPLNEIPKGKTELFTCSLCGYDLEAGGTVCTDEDWYQHVLEDLEPYLCTFDTCFSAQETYSQIDEWYRHELESHRIKKTWACPACAAEFDTKLEATEHVVQTHGGDFQGPKEVAMLKAMLRQTLSSHTLGAQACPLCGIRIEASVCKRHIGKHLEYFALLSLANDDDTSEEGNYLNDNAQSDDGMSERGRKEMFLNAFVTEQLKLDLQQGKIPPDVLMEGSNRVDLLDDMSDHGESRDSRSNVGGAPHDDPKRMLIDRMFRTSSAGDVVSKQAHRTAVRGTGAGVPKSGAIGGGSGTMDEASRRHEPPAASTTSSSEKLPLLRTWSSPRSPDFMGRDKELVSLYKILSEPGRVCVLSGEGGMGKSALAVEYTWRFEQNYHYIFWVDAETSVGRGDTFCEIAQQLHLAPGGTDQDTLIRLGREFLEQVKDKRWLMVLDNVDRWEDIDLFTPSKTSATQGSILITTRHSNFTAPSRPVNDFRVYLEGLSVDEGRKLLLHGLPEEQLPEEMSLRNADYKSAGDIASIGGLPLLIMYISGYIKRSGCTLLEFWEYWNEWRANERLGGGGSGGDGGGDAEENGKQAETSSRDTVLHVAIGDLGLGETKVLEVMAFLNSNGVQREVLEWNDPQKPGPPYLMKNRLRLIIGKLKGQKIVTEKIQGHRVVYTVHGLLLSKLMQGMNVDGKKRNEVFGIAFDLIRNRLPRPSLDTPEQASWDAFREYLPLVLSLQRAYEDPLSIVPIRPFLGLAELFKDGGVLLWQRYIHGDALKLLHSAEKVVDELTAEAEAEGKSATDETRALRCEIDVTTNLLLQYFGISHRKEIKERSARILQYRESVFHQLQPPVSREDVLVVVDAQADYANTLLQFNDFRAAEVIYQTCLDKYREFGAVGDQGTAFAVAKLQHHLAYCLMYRRAFGEALALAETAVSIIEQVSDVAMTMRYRFDLGCIQLQSGALEQALDTQRAILAARLDFQGRASYFTLQSQYAVAALCHVLGRLDEAEGLLRTALGRATARGSKHFWPEAALARTKYHLSLVMADQAAVADQSDTAATNAGADRRAKRAAEARRLAIEAKDVLSRMLPYDPEPILGVREEDTLALFDHLQPVFGGRFTSTKLLQYVARE